MHAWLLSAAQPKTRREQREVSSPGADKEPSTPTTSTTPPPAAVLVAVVGRVAAATAAVAELRWTRERLVSLSPWSNSVRAPALRAIAGGGCRRGAVACGVAGRDCLPAVIASLRLSLEASLGSATRLLRPLPVGHRCLASCAQRA
jgi:hypothetical protein